MADKGGSSGKGPWPDMRSLRWPPEGVEAVPKGAGASNEPIIPPFELAPDPRGTGGVVAVPIPERPLEVVTVNETPPLPPAVATLPTPEIAADTSFPDAAVPASLPHGAAVAAEAPGAAVDGSCQAGLIVAELRALRSAVEALTAAITGMGVSRPRTAPGTGVVPVRVVSDHQARAEIQEYFLRHQGETLYPAQIADALNLPVLKVAELCEALALRGRISRNPVS